MSEIDKHIQEKIDYHEELRLKYEIEEDYEQCVIARNEIARLKSLLKSPNIGLVSKD